MEANSILNFAIVVVRIIRIVDSINSYLESYLNDEFCQVTFGLTARTLRNFQLDFTATNCIVVDVVLRQ